MEQLEEPYQNGHARSYKEVAEDGTVTEYREEKYVVEENIGKQSKSSDEVEFAGVVVLQDDDDVKVYQQHEVLDDGREVITTTTIRLNESGEATEETVTEIVELEEIEVSEEEEEEETEETEDDKHLLDDVPEENDKTESADEEVGDGEQNEEEDEGKEQVEEDEGKEQVEEDVGSLLAAQKQTEDSSDEPVKAMRRHISYEEFAEQYTEYKPPKRYEKKQHDTAADKAAPKIRIMTDESTDSPCESNNETPAADGLIVESEGLPNNDFYSAPSGNADLISPSRSGSQGVDSISEEVNTNQPTRTQGSVIRRMDQGANVDPANVVRSEDKQDIGAELPLVGTSQSMKSKFQSMEGEQSRPIDFSQPVKRERPRTGQFGYSTAPVVSPTGDIAQSNHHIPEFEGGEIENTPMVRDDVVREADRNDQVELPESGQARSLLSKWSQIETESSKQKEYKPSGIGSKPAVTPLRPSSHVEVENTVEHVIPEVEGGEYENTPVQRTDVIKETDTAALEEELPTVGLAKDIMSKFKQKEEDAKKAPAYQPSGAGNRNQATYAPKVHSRPTSTCSAEAHVEPEFETGAVESTPVVRGDVIRESDRNDEQELPERGYAQNLKARFRELREQQIPSDYVQHKPSGVANKATPTPIRLGNTNGIGTPINSQSTVNDETDLAYEPEVESGEYENQPIKRTDVSREEDRLDEQELPEIGIAKSLMNQFKTLESQTTPSYKPSGVAAKATPSKLHIMAGKTAYNPKGFAPEPVVNSDDPEERVVEAGEYENTPTVRDDVVRADTVIYHKELPEEGVTRNIMSRFKSMEEDQKSTVQHRPSKVASKPTPTPLRPSSVAAIDPSNTASETLSSDRLEAEGGEHESVPEVNHNLVRSSDTNDNDYVPSAGAAKTLMSN